MLALDVQTLDCVLSKYNAFDVILFYIIDDISCDAHGEKYILITLRFA